MKKKTKTNKQPSYSVIKLEILFQIQTRLSAAESAFISYKSENK